MSVTNPLSIHPYVSNHDITHSQSDKHLQQSSAGPNHPFKAHKQYNHSCQGGGRRPAITHLQTYVFALFLGHQAEDDTGGGTRPNPNLDYSLSSGQGPQELELNVAPAIKRKLWGHLSIKNTQGLFNYFSCHIGNA